MHRTRGGWGAGDIVSDWTYSTLEDVIEKYQTPVFVDLSCWVPVPVREVFAVPKAFATTLLGRRTVRVKESNSQFVHSSHHPTHAPQRHHIAAELFPMKVVAYPRIEVPSRIHRHLQQSTDWQNQLQPILLQEQHCCCWTQGQGSALSILQEFDDLVRDIQ